MANNDLYFRIATLGDAPRIQQLVEAAFRAEDVRPNWTADMNMGRNFRVQVEKVTAQITKPDAGILVAIDKSGSIVASVEIWKRESDLARLSMLAVDQGIQRGGVGRQVLSSAEDYCQQIWGVKRFSLDALSTREELIAWYMRRGYHKTGELIPFPVKEINGQALPEDLSFVQLEKDLI